MNGSKSRVPNEMNYSREIPLRFQCDVLVAGGGLGGVAAAVSAARAGADTILIERNGFLGGVATAGMCCSVFHCLATRDREIRVKGIPLEIVDALAVKAGPGISWRCHKGHVIYDVEKGKLLLHELCREAGVRVLLDTPVADVIMEGRTLKGLLVSGQDGIYAIEAKNIVDSTGECVVAELSGASMKRHQPDANAMRHSYVFRLGCVDVDAFVNYLLANPDQYAQNMDIEWMLDEAVAQYRENGTFLFPHGGGMQMRIVNEALRAGRFSKQLGMYDSLDAMQMHMIRDKGVAHVITGFVRVSSLDAATLSQAVLEGKRMAFYVADFFRREMPGFERSFVSQTADDLGIRVSRLIDGRATFTREMQAQPYRCDDPIGVGVVEEHVRMHPGKNAWSAQVFGDDVYQIPLGCLLPVDTEGLIIGAGRGASTEPPAILRVMVVTMICGQGAGVAAAMASKLGESVSAVDYDAVRGELERQGVAFDK